MLLFDVSLDIQLNRVRAPHI